MIFKRLILNTQHCTHHTVVVLKNFLDCWVLKACRVGCWLVVSSRCCMHLHMLLAGARLLGLELSSTACWFKALTCCLGLGPWSFEAIASVATC